MKDLEAWWATEPFGFDNTDTYAGIKTLIETRKEKIDKLEKQNKIMEEVSKDLLKYAYIKCDPAGERLRTALKKCKEIK